MRKWHWVRIYLLTTGCYPFFWNWQWVGVSFHNYIHIILLNISTYIQKNDIVAEYPSCMALSFLTWIKVGETIGDIWYYWSSYLVCCFWGTLSTKHVVQHDFDFCLFAIGIIPILREHGWIGCSFFVSSRMGQFSRLRWHSLWGTVRLSGRVWIIVCVFIMNRVGCDLVLRWNGWIICMLFIVAWGLIVV